MALAMKALPGLQARLAGSRVTPARPACNIRRLPVQHRVVSVATASADAPETSVGSEKQQILKEIEEANAQLTEAGVNPELFAIWDDEAEEGDEGEDADASDLADADDEQTPDEDDYDGPEALVSTLYDDENDRLLGTQVLYDVDGELVEESAETDALLKDSFPTWFANAFEEVEEAEAEATEGEEQAELDYDEDDQDLDEEDMRERRELEVAVETREEATALLQSWKPELLDELYPNGKVPGFNKQQSRDLWRTLRYFLAIEAVDAGYEVQNLEGDTDIIELDDDDDFEEEDLDEDTEEDVALYDEVDALTTEFDVSVNPKDRVYGTVYRVTEDGAYVELSGKSSGYVPLSECSVAKLSSVGTRCGFAVHSQRLTRICPACCMRRSCCQLAQLEALHTCLCLIPTSASVTLQHFCVLRQSPTAQAASMLAVGFLI
jgi:hypothetical protein